jgi:hypothetical protein
MRNFKKIKDRKQLKNSCGKGKKGCNYEGEPTLKTKVKIAA